MTSDRAELVAWFARRGVKPQGVCSFCQHVLKRFVERDVLGLGADGVPSSAPRDMRPAGLLYTLATEGRAAYDKMRKRFINRRLHLEEKAEQLLHDKAHRHVIYCYLLLAGREADREKWNSVLDNQQTEGGEEMTKYNVSIRRGSGFVIGDNAKVVNGEGRRVVSTPDSGGIAIGGRVSNVRIVTGKHNVFIGDADGLTITADGVFIGGRACGDVLLDWAETLEDRPVQLYIAALVSGDTNAADAASPRVVVRALQAAYAAGSDVYTCLHFLLFPEDYGGK